MLQREQVADRVFRPAVRTFPHAKATIGMNLLFVCSRNKLRSPTAEHVFSEDAGIETDSAGTDNDADVPLTPELIEWADVVFAMESMHAAQIRRRYAKHLKARLVVLGIPDRFAYMDEELVRLLRNKVGPHLRLAGSSK
jgi:predicted protein tyrosine phosphatase